MSESKRILFISQEIYPFLATETPIRVLNRQLPELLQSKGYETRTFMPKFGDINERRNQLHEVIRLSGTNIIINDSDHPLVIKVTSIPSARIQIYFIDDDTYFHRRKGIGNEKGEYADNDERSMFFTRGTIETIKKLCWTPNIIHCSGWLSALAPLYLKKVYNKTPFFANAKIVLALDDNDYKQPFPTAFADKLMMDGLSKNDVRSIYGFPVGYEELMRMAIDNSDALIYSTPNVNQRLMNYAETSGKPIMAFNNYDTQDYLNLYNSLL